MSESIKARPLCARARCLAPLLAGAVLVPVAAHAAEQPPPTDNATTTTTTTTTVSGADGSRLDTITVEGNRLYEMLPSEQTGGYSVDAATVGTKTPASLRDIPQSISVVTRDAIEDQNFDSLDQLARRTPSMRVLTNDDGRSSIYSRGYEYNEYNIDGLPAPMSSITGSVPSLAPFDRVEIMRGPSGLFNSTSEMGGIVNLVRKRPTYDFQGNVTGRYGNYGQRYIESDISGPISSDGSVRGRLVVDSTDNDGFVDRNDNQRSNFYGALDIDLDADTTLALAFLRQHKDIQVNNGLPTDADGNLVDFRRSQSFGADWNAFNSQSNDWIAELTHSFDNGAYGRVAARYSNRNADYNYAFAGGSPIETGSTTAAGIGSIVDEESVSFDASYSQPFQTFDNVSEFVVGTDYKRYDTEQETGRTRSLTGGQVDADAFGDIRYVDIVASARRSGRGYASSDDTLEEYGLYSKLTFRPVQNLALIGGARVSHYDVEYNDRVADSERTRSDEEFTPYAGLVYDLDAHHSLYASYSQVFNPQSDVDIGGNIIEPREGDQYEAGIKGSYFNGDLNARLSAFRLYDENRAATPADGANDYVVPIGEIRIQGAELELIGSVTDQWDVIAGYTYLDTEVKTASSPRGDGTFLLMPENTVNLWTQYSFESGRLDGVHIGGGVTAMDSFSGFADPQVEAPGYAVVDAMIGYDFTSQLKGTLNFNNIFDREYYTRVGSTNTFNFYGEPANVVAELSYDF